MNRFLFVFLAILSVCFMTSCDDEPRLVGSRDITTQTRDFVDFTAVEASDIIDVSIRQGSEFSVTVRANDNIIDRVLTQQRGNTLELDLDGGNYRNVTVEVDIVMPIITEFKIDAAGDGDIRGFFNLTDLRLEVSGAGDLDISSSSVHNLEGIVSGAGDINAFGLTAAEATLKVSGAGDMELTVTDRLGGEVSGAGDLYYRGNPSLEINVSGAGDLVNAN